MSLPKNAIVHSCFNHVIGDANLCVGAKLALLRTISVDIFKQKLRDAVNPVRYGGGGGL